MNLSFAGCGFLGIYHVGVAVCFKKYAPHLLLDKISGASAGAIAACCLLCDLPIGDITTDVLNLIREARARTLGPFSPSFNVQAVLLEGLSKVLPEDAHLRVNGKLHISLTRVCDGRNVLVSHFDSKDDLLQALLASAFVPIFSGLIPPEFHGYRYIDGGFSDNLPTLDENTITVSPFCGESDICPRDFSSQLFHVNVANTSIELSRQNIHRFARILWPPKPEVLSNMCKQGFDDALRFLHRNNLINCTRCLAVQSTFVVSEIVDETFEYDPQCQECKQHRQEALVANLPDTVLSLFQDAIDSANKGLVNWIFKHRGMKLLSVLTLPYTLPVDFIYAVFRKFIVSAPHLLDNLSEMCKFLVSQINNLLCRWNIKKHQLSANVSCQIALTKYDSDKETSTVPETKPAHLKNKMNFNFKLNLDDSDLDQTGKVSADRILSRRSSYVLQHQQQQLIQQPKVEEEETLPLADDTFENILDVTTKHDALMAFYYMDGNNKLKVTEIFEVTEDEVKNMLNESDSDNPDNRDWAEKNKDWIIKQELFNENDLELSSSSKKVMDGYEAEDDRSESDQSDYLEKATIFSDPESEWASQVVMNDCCHDIEDELNLSRSSPVDCRPESDQSHSSLQTLV